MTNEVQVNKYPKGNDLRCPHCHSESVEWGDINISDKSAYQRVYCSDCDAEWYDVYKLIGFKDLVIPEDK